MARPGMKEMEISAEVERIAIAAGGGVAFPVIATINGQTLHNHYHGNSLSDGDLFLLDTGAETPTGYAGDLTSTFPVSPRFSDQQKLIYYKRWWHFDKCDGSDIRFTRSKDGTRLYVIVLGWPKGGKLHVASLSDKTRLADGPIKSVTLLDGSKPAQWTRGAAGMDITMPEGTSQDQPAYAFKIGVEGKLDLGE